MNKLFKRISRLILCFTLICIMSTTHAFSKPLGDNWIKLPEKTGVPLDKTWTINFSDKVALEDIDGIVVEKDNKFVPIDVSFIGENSIKIKPMSSYERNSEYYLKIFLNNGSRYYMSFKTIIEQIDYLQHDVEFIDTKGNYDSDFAIFYNKNLLYMDNGININYNKSYSYGEMMSMNNVKEEYKNSLIMASDSRPGSTLSVEFPILKKYKKFKARIGIEYFTKDSNSITELTILGDGKVLYDHQWQDGEFPEDIDLDVSNVERLTFKVDRVLGEGYQFIGVYNPELFLK